MLPFSHLEKTVVKPLGRGFNRMPESIGYQIRKRRLELKLEQSDLAELFGVSHNVVGNWERNEAMPNSKHRPKLVQFLGPVPWEIDQSTFGGKLEHARLLKGLSMDELAKLIGVKKAKISRLERNVFKPKPDVLLKLKEILDL